MQPIDKKGESASVTIIHHPDVRRELLSIKATVEGERMLAYWISMQLDISQKDPDEKARKRAKNLVDLLIPVVKAHFTDNAVENTNSAIQVFGGHGYIKEHGMEQFNRDARITRLYEGTNGIQGLDLVGRKILVQNLLFGYIKQVRADVIKAVKNGVSFCLIFPLVRAVWKLLYVTVKLQAGTLIAKSRGKMGPAMIEAAGMATDYYKLLSLVTIGHMWIKMADEATLRLKSNPEGRDFYETKIKTARFYMKKIMPQAKALSKSIRTGAQVLMEIPADKFAHTQTTIGVK